MKRIALIFIICSTLTLGLGALSNNKTSANGTLKLMQGLQNFGFSFYNYSRLDSISSVPLSDLMENRRKTKSDLSSNTSESQCRSHLEAIRNGLLANDLWSVKCKCWMIFERIFIISNCLLFIVVIDSWAKIPSGILHGHLLEMGNFDECLSITHDISSLKSSLKGKYCLAQIPFEKFVLKLGICVPAVCRADEINVLLESTPLKSLLRPASDERIAFIQESKCSTAEAVQFKPVDWAAVGVLLLIFVLITISTLYDYAVTHFEKISTAVLSAFSLRSNIKELFSCKTSRNAPHVIPCLYGIRCLSIIWVIFGHCYMMLLLSPNINSIDIFIWARSPFSMLIQLGTVSVDTFFFLSGLLLVMVTLRQMDRNGGHINIPLMYLHRYLRLTPVLAVAMLLFVSLYRYMGNGPLWFAFTNSNLLCNQTWWATLLYVQNYAAAGRMCFGHSWYLAVDMQLYVVSPLILIPIWKWKRRGVAGLVVLGLLMFAALVCVIVLNDYVVFKTAGNLGADNVEMRNIYYSTHSRVSPWLIGVIFGYFMHKRAGRQKKLSKVIITLGWALSLSLIGSVVFSLYGKTQQDATPLTPLEGAFYLSLSRIAWPLGLVWIVFACENGNAGPISHFLSWPFWQPMSRLSYCMYIWHLVIESINAGRLKTNTYFSNYDAILHFWGNFGVTILVSIVMYLAVESPMNKIEQGIFSQRRIPRQVNTCTATDGTISQENLCDK